MEDESSLAKIKSNIQKAAMEIKSWKRKVDLLKSEIKKCEESIKKEEGFIKEFDIEYEVKHDLTTALDNDLKWNFEIGRLSKIHKIELAVEDSKIDPDLEMNLCFIGILKELENEIDFICVNEKSAEQYEALGNKGKLLLVKIEEASTAKKDIDTRFESLRNERIKKHTKAFEIVSKSVNKNYEKLTGSSSGKAKLILVNEEGFEYRVHPPLKKRMCWRSDRCCVSITFFDPQFKSATAFSTR